MTDTFNRARLAILNRVMQAYLSEGGYAYNQVATQEPIIGDLAAMSAAPASNWYLSWVEDITPTPNGDSIYGLRSIETSEICNWSNVGIRVFNREDVANHPQWRWSDKQWAFWDRWKLPSEHPYMTLPCMPIFEGLSVTLSTRSRFNLAPDSHISRTFPDWRKVTKKQMLELYREAVSLSKT